MSPDVMATAGEVTELLLPYTVFPYVGRILNMPTMMAVAEGDDITLWDLEIAAYNLVTTPTNGSSRSRK
jgi:hypothetical protein